MILQSDPEWATARLGHVTASRIADLLAKARSGGGWGVTRANYAAELVAERLTGVAAERFVSDAMRHGVDTESLACAAYEFRFDVSCAPAAFVPHPEILWAAATPDRFVNDDGLVEFKCPNTATHIETLLGADIARPYRLQMQWQMACTGRQWCDFVSFDPRLPEEHRMFVRRVARDAEAIASIENDVINFLGEVSGTIAALQARAA